MFHFPNLVWFRCLLFCIPGRGCVVLFLYPVRLIFTHLTHVFVMFKFLVFLCLTVCDRRICVPLG